MTAPTPCRWCNAVFAGSPRRWYCSGACRTESRRALLVAKRRRYRVKHGAELRAKWRAYYTAHAGRLNARQRCARRKGEREARSGWEAARRILGGEDPLAGVIWKALVA